MIYIGPRNCSDPAYTAPPPSTGSTTPSTCDSPGAICLQGGQNSSEGNILIENRYKRIQTLNTYPFRVALNLISYSNKIFIYSIFFCKTNL